MCKGVESGECVSSSGGAVLCELCGAKASLYCPADGAHLCTKCDTWVHAANFLALRHVRCFLCNTCQNLTQKCLIGASTQVSLPTILSLYSPRNQCSNSHVHKCCSKLLHRPFLSL